MLGLRNTAILLAAVVCCAAPAAMGAMGAMGSLPVTALVSAGPHMDAGHIHLANPRDRFAGSALR